MRTLFVSAINKRSIFPKIIVMVIDADLAHSLQHDKFGITHILGSAIMWLASEMHKIILAQKEKLPKKSKKDSYLNGSSTTLTYLDWEDSQVMVLIDTGMPLIKQYNTGTHLSPQRRRYCSIHKTITQRVQDRQIFQLLIHTDSLDFMWTEEHHMRNISYDENCLHHPDTGKKDTIKIFHICIFTTCY